MAVTRRHRPTSKCLCPTSNHPSKLISNGGSEKHARLQEVIIERRIQVRNLFHIDYLQMFQILFFFLNIDLLSLSESFKLKDLIFLNWKYGTVEVGWSKLS